MNDYEKVTKNEIDHNPTINTYYLQYNRGIYSFTMPTFNGNDSFPTRLIQAMNIDNGNKTEFQIEKGPWEYNVYKVIEEKDTGKHLSRPDIDLYRRINENKYAYLKKTYPIFRLKGVLEQNHHDYSESIAEWHDLTQPSYSTKSHPGDFHARLDATRSKLPPFMQQNIRAYEDRVNASARSFVPRNTGYRTAKHFFKQAQKTRRASMVKPNNSTSKHSSKLRREYKKYKLKKSRTSNSLNGGSCNSKRMS